MDLRSLFQKGYSVTKIEKSLADKVLEAMPRQTFKYPDKITQKEHPMYHSDTGLFYCECVTPFTSDQPPLMGRGFHEGDLDFFTEFWGLISSSETYKWYRESFGPVTRFSKQMHDFKKGESLGFHFDYKDATPFINILYVGDDDFTEGDGGYLEVGKCRVTDGFEIIRDSIEVTGRIFPNHGTLVTLNNMTPYFVHSVARLMSSKKRYSFICQFGHKENELYSLISKGWNIR